MTDQPRPLKVFTCYNPRKPTESCYGLVEDAAEPRRLHREWHAHEEAVKKGLRDTLTKQAENHARLIAARDDEIAALRSEVADLSRDVTGIEVPLPVLGIEIDRGGYRDDELDTEGDEEAEPDTVADATVSNPAAVADAVAAFTAPQGDAPVPPAIDRPDEPTWQTGAYDPFQPL